MQLTLPEGVFKAYLFDCDGTIADSMPLHYVAWNSILTEYGASFPERLFYAWGGRPIRDILDTLNQEQDLDMPVEDIAKRKEAMYFDLLHELKAVPEVLEHILLSHGKIPFAVVSGSERPSVVASLEALGILDRFDTLVCAGDYVNGKPAPDPFLLAAERLGVDPKDCLVFEDTDMGIASATAAGMASVRILQPHERPQTEEML
jgi:HAD superfamily hydrolase (TIGR01509 family)